MEITVQLKTKHPYGFRTARGRNGDFIAAKALVCSTREKDMESGEAIINLKVYSRQRGDAAPIFLCLQIQEWWEIMSAIERIFWQSDDDTQKEGGRDAG